MCHIVETYGEEDNHPCKQFKNKADFQEVKYGYNIQADTPSLFRCSVCDWSDNDTYTGDTATYNYCPNCGAKMDGGKSG